MWLSVNFAAEIDEHMHTSYGDMHMHVCIYRFTVPELFLFYFFVGVQLNKPSVARRLQRDTYEQIGIWSQKTSSGVEGLTETQLTRLKVAIHDQFGLPVTLEQSEVNRRLECGWDATGVPVW